MGFRQTWPFLLSLSVFAFCCGQVTGIHSDDEARKLYIVYMGEKQHDDPDLVTGLHHDTLASVLGSEEAARASIVYSYKHGFSGFSAMLTGSQAKKIAGLPSVIQVHLSRDVRLQTTRSWDYLGLNYNHPTELLQRSNFGEDIIVGIIDTGIWPESRSFKDDGYGPVPARWKGICQTGQAFDASNCSRKIIGARFYASGIDPKHIKADYRSPRGMHPHGTHAASIAVGTPVERVSFHGLASGTARGGAPRARLAVYKVMWGTGVGNDATVLAAIDDAIHDGVDILSLSLIVNENSFGSLHAVAKGITVVYAGGNNGPAAQTVANTAPWVITVAASTIDRSYPTAITLGNNQTLVGQAIYYYGPKDNKFRGLVYGIFCDEETLNRTDIKGKVVLCQTSNSVALPGPFPQFVVAARNVANAGGWGLIFVQYTLNALQEQRCAGIACVFVDGSVGMQIGEYLETASAPVAKLGPTVTVVGSEVLSPKVAAFSSRGPSVLPQEILKHGYELLCYGAARHRSTRRHHLGREPGLLRVHVGNVDGHTTRRRCGGLAQVPSSPLVSRRHKISSGHHCHDGVNKFNRLLPWPCLLIEASTTDFYGLPIKAEAIPRKTADPFDFGGGQINPNRAVDPGLVYDIGSKDYKAFARCTLGGVIPVCDPPPRPAYQLNLPSIAIPNLKTSVTVRRTVTNVGEVEALYKAVLEPPLGVETYVEPTTLVFNATVKRQTFKVVFSTAVKAQGDYMFGSLTWIDGKHSVRIPIAVRIVVNESYADVS